MTQVIKAGNRPRQEELERALLNLHDVADEARQIILEARRESVRILAQARRQAETAYTESLEQARREGWEQGLREGRQEGQRAARDAAEARLDEQGRQLAAVARRLVEDLAAARQQVLDQGPQEMLRFAIELARRIVGRVACEDLDVARENLARVLRLASAGETIVLEVNPQQLELLRTSCQPLIEAMGRGGTVRLVACEDVQPGGVRAQTPRGTLDATISTQLDRLVDALLGDSSPPAAEGAALRESA